MTVITIHMHKNDGLEFFFFFFFFFSYFHIREVLSHSRECGSQAALLGGSRMIQKGSHLCLRVGILGFGFKKLVQALLSFCLFC